jgi:hypothetical protein
MIDIHPPQHAPMARRDFFVHLFIVILIAYRTHGDVP